MPFLKDLAENQNLNIRLTAQQIEEADKASKAMARMRAESSFVSQTLVTSAIPAFSVLAEELKKILLGTDNAVAGISRLRDDGTLAKWAETSAYAIAVLVDNYVEIRDAQEGAYEFSLRAIGITRKESVPATLSAAVLGKTLPPSDVTGFLVQRRASDLLISWDELQDADLAGYEVRVGAGWDNGQLVAKTAGTQMVHDQSAAGLYPYHIRAYDTSGNYSAHVTTFVLSLQAPSTVRQFDVVQSANRLEFRWQPNPEPEVVGYELREGAAWDASLFVAEVKSTNPTSSGPSSRRPSTAWGAT